MLNQIIRKKKKKQGSMLLTQMKQLSNCYFVNYCLANKKKKKNNSQVFVIDFDDLRLNYVYTNCNFGKYDHRAQVVKTILVGYLYFVIFCNLYNW